MNSLFSRTSMDLVENMMHLSNHNRNNSPWLLPRMVQQRRLASISILQCHNFLIQAQLNRLVWCIWLWNPHAQAILEGKIPISMSYLIEFFLWVKQNRNLLSLKISWIPSINCIVCGILYEFVTKWAIQMRNNSDALNINTYSITVSHLNRKYAVDEMNIKDIVVK